MIPKIYYIGWLISDEDIDLFKGNVPGNLKMKYVVEQMQECGLTPHVVSLAQRRKKGLYGTIKKIVQKGNLPVLYCAGFNGLGIFGRKLDGFIKRTELLLYLFCVVRRTDRVVLYHSYPFTKFVSRFKKLLKCKIILEVEELYGFSAVADKPWVGDEINAVRKMDNFICVNEGIPKLLGLQEGQFVVNYGVGKIPNRNAKRRDDGRIHVVYAGTIETMKLGAMTAVDAAPYLTDDYVIHIIGFGTDENVKRLKEHIEEINAECGSTRVEYNGYYFGEELDKFLFGCHIGLSSNVMRPNFANNTFPSKVITYMCHDLAVVVGYADAFYDVPMSKGWTFYHEFSPEKIAAAIKAAEVVPIGYYHQSILTMNSDLQSFIKDNVLGINTLQGGGKMYKQE